MHVNNIYWNIQIFGVLGFWGFGSHVENLLSEKGIFDKGLKFRTMILPDIFIEQDSPKKMYDVAGLNASQISKKILDILFTKESIKVVKN